MVPAQVKNDQCCQLDGSNMTRSSRHHVHGSVRVSQRAMTPPRARQISSMNASRVLVSPAASVMGELCFLPKRLSNILQRACGQSLRLACEAAANRRDEMNHRVCDWNKLRQGRTDPVSGSQLGGNQLFGMSGDNGLWGSVSEPGRGA